MDMKTETAVQDEERGAALFTRGAPTSDAGACIDVRNLDGADRDGSEPYELSPHANVREAAEAELRAPPAPPARPTDTSASALLAHWHAVNNWIQNDVHTHLHGDDAIDKATDILANVFNDLSDAPCLTTADALAKLSLLQADDDGLGECGDEMKRPIIDQVSAFLNEQATAPADPLVALAARWHELRDADEALSDRIDDIFMRSLDLPVPEILQSWTSMDSQVFGLPVARTSGYRPADRRLIEQRMALYSQPVPLTPFQEQVLARGTELLAALDVHAAAMDQFREDASFTTLNNESCALNEEMEAIEGQIVGGHPISQEGLRAKAGVVGSIFGAPDSSYQVSCVWRLLADLGVRSPEIEARAWIKAFLDVGGSFHLGEAKTGAAAAVHLAWNPENAPDGMLAEMHPNNPLLPVVLQEARRQMIEDGDTVLISEAGRAAA